MLQSNREFWKKLAERIWAQVHHGGGNWKMFAEEFIRVLHSTTTDLELRDVLEADVLPVWAQNALDKYHEEKVRGLTWGRSKPATVLLHVPD